MKSWRKPLAVLTLTGVAAGAGFVGVDLVQNVQFARAEQRVEASRQELSTVQGLSDVFRDVARTVEPSVVNIRVTKTIEGPHGNAADAGTTSGVSSMTTTCPFLRDSSTARKAP